MIGDRKKKKNIFYFFVFTLFQNGHAEEEKPD